MERNKVKKIKKTTKYIVSNKLEKAFVYLERNMSSSNKKLKKFAHSLKENGLFEKNCHCNHKLALDTIN